MDQEPLASRMRPLTLPELLGQDHLLGEGRLLRSMLESGTFRNLLLFGPPGTGKTSLLSVIQRHAKMPFVSLNATQHGVKEMREVIPKHGGPIMLHVDEVHRLSKPQAEVLLPASEKGTIVFIGTTTEIPQLEVPPALLSRSTVMELKPLTADAIATGIQRALTDAERGLGFYRPLMSDELVRELAGAVDGDLRQAYTALELAVLTTKETTEGRLVTRDWLWECLRKERHTFSTSDLYDCLSGLQKSIRGSSPDAALHYLARLISVRCELEIICRRLAVIPAEDVGIAFPNAITVTMACLQAALMAGYPEAKIPLAQAVTYLALLPKSSAAYNGIREALADVENGKGRTVPEHLRDKHFKGADQLWTEKYRNPHDYDGNWVEQDYLPADLKGKSYYKPTDNGQEKQFKERLEQLRQRRSPHD